MRSYLTILALVPVLPLPAMAQSLDEPEFSYVMTMQFNGCSMTEDELSAQLQLSGIDRAAQDAKTSELIARGDATVTDEADGTRRISMPEWACAPVETLEFEAVAEPLTPQGAEMPYRDEVYTSVMATNGCTMTRAEIAEQMTGYGLRPILHEPMTDALIDAGMATVTDEADGSQRVSLAPEICTPGAPVTTLIAAKPESVAMFAEHLLARNCAVGIEELESLEAELGLEPAETYPITVVMELAGEGRMDFEGGAFRLIHEDCP
jgi:hypothetical protein